MMMTKKVMFFGGMLAVALMMLPAHAALTDLPEGYLTGWGGKSTYYLNLGGGDFLHGRIEFAVYDTSSTGFEAPGGKQYMYVYQIFNNGAKATAAITYFSLTGIAPEAIDSVDDDIEARSSGGIDPTYYEITPSKTEAVFVFDDGMLVVGEKSAYLLLGSDYAPIHGGYAFRPPDSGVPVPGQDGRNTPVPEPATLALLLGGALVALRKRKH